MAARRSPDARAPRALRTALLALLALLMPGASGGASGGAAGDASGGAADAGDAGAPRLRDRLLVQGLAEAEAWNTDTHSDLLGRADGEPAPLGRLRLWAAAQFADQVQGFALGRLSGGSASEEGTRVTLEQAWLRWTAAPPLHLVVQAGRLIQPLGNFSRRYLATDNPLVGAPAGGDLSYSNGLQVNGAAGRIDWLAAALDGPMTREEYTSAPSSSVRPAAELGVTPLTGFRLGLFATQGSYLGRREADRLPPGASWRDYDERVAGLDLRFSRGHFELNGQQAWTRLQVPGAGDARKWLVWLEPKYTWSPRWFTAMRIERGLAASVEPQPAGPWAVETGKILDLEIGAGFRIDPRWLAKASYRAALSGTAAGVEPGSAVAVQLSYDFDVSAWIDRPR